MQQPECWGLSSHLTSTPGVFCPSVVWTQLSSSQWTLRPILQPILVPACQSWTPRNTFDWDLPVATACRASCRWITLPFRSSSKISLFSPSAPELRVYGSPPPVNKCTRNSNSCFRPKPSPTALWLMSLQTMLCRTASSLQNPLFLPQLPLPVYPISRCQLDPSSFLPEALRSLLSLPITVRLHRLPLYRSTEGYRNQKTKNIDPTKTKIDFNT